MEERAVRCSNSPPCVATAGNRRRREAYDYIVNGKPAIEWVMERQAVTTDKASGIVNDASLWATETVGNAAYPLELLLRIITVSLETNRIVESLPALEIG
ncbi:MAG TPA: type ISP restriction/modification enzyme [Planctomycetaceae bacterium]|nr:type ISP restriction/modification enzyme [Planctomycetaceae bacterium]